MGLRTSRSFYNPRMGAPVGDALSPEGSGVTVLLPVRYIAFDTLRDPVSTFGPGEGEKDKEATFEPGRLREIAFNPNLHKGAALQGNLLRHNDFQITYSFPAERRSGVRAILGASVGALIRYGSERFTYRQLYDFLCARFNGGERFVDVYFQMLFPHSAAGRAFQRFEKTVHDELNGEYDRRWVAAFERKHTRFGAPDLRTAPGLRLKEFDAWKTGRVAAAMAELERFRRDVRDEIIQSLSTGRIPLNHRDTSETLELRRRLGLDSKRVFHASGALIQSIEIDIRMPEDAFAV